MTRDLRIAILMILGLLALLNAVQTMHWDATIKHAIGGTK